METSAMDLSGSVSIVTGAGQGIGRACAAGLAAAGAHVVVADIDGEAAKTVAEAISADGGPDPMAITADVGDLEQIDRMVGATIERFGHLDSIVNNAGVTRRAYIMELTEEDFDWIHRVNVKGVFFCLQRAAKEMIPHRKGAIINIASVAGRGYAGTSNAIYAASKGAVISLTRTAAQQLARHNINVNAVCPGVVRTSLYDRVIAKRAEAKGFSIAEAEAEAARGIPLRRANEPEDIAAMVVFLASEGARNITGQSLNVDGGLILS